MSFLRTAYKVIPLPQFEGVASDEDVRASMAAALEKILKEYVDDCWTFASIASARCVKDGAAELVDLVILERGS